MPDNSEFRGDRSAGVNLIIKAAGFECPRLEKQPLPGYLDKTGKRCPIVLDGEQQAPVNPVNYYRGRHMTNNLLGKPGEIKKKAAFIYK